MFSQLFYSWGYLEELLHFKKRTHVPPRGYAFPRCRFGSKSMKKNRSVSNSAALLLPILCCQSLLLCHYLVLCYTFHSQCCHAMRLYAPTMPVV